MQSDNGQRARQGSEKARKKGTEAAQQKLFREELLRETEALFTNAAMMVQSKMPSSDVVCDWMDAAENIGGSKSQQDVGKQRLGSPAKPPTATISISPQQVVGGNESTDGEKTQKASNALVEKITFDPLPRMPESTSHRRDKEAVSNRSSVNAKSSEDRDKDTDEVVSIGNTNQRSPDEQESVESGENGQCDKKYIRALPEGGRSSHQGGCQLQGESSFSSQSSPFSKLSSIVTAAGGPQEHANQELVDKEEAWNDIGELSQRKRMRFSPTAHPTTGSNSEGNRLKAKSLSNKEKPQLPINLIPGEPMQDPSAVLSRTSSKKDTLRLVFGKTRGLERDLLPKSSYLQGQEQTSSSHANLKQHASAREALRVHLARKLGLTMNGGQNLLAISEDSRPSRPGTLETPLHNLSPEAANADAALAPRPPLENSWLTPLEELDSLRRSAERLESEVDTERKNLSVELGSPNPQTTQTIIRIQEQIRVMQELCKMAERARITYEQARDKMTETLDSGSSVFIDTVNIQTSKPNSSITAVTTGGYDGADERKLPSSNAQTWRTRPQLHAQEKFVDSTLSNNAVDLLASQQQQGKPWPQKGYFREILSLQTSSDSELTRPSNRSSISGEPTRDKIPSLQHTYAPQKARLGYPRSLQDFNPVFHMRPRFGLLTTDPDFVSDYRDKRLSERFRSSVGSYIHQSLLQFQRKLSIEKLCDMGREHAQLCFKRMQRTPQGSKRVTMAKGASPTIVQGLREKLCRLTNTNPHKLKKIIPNDNFAASHLFATKPSGPNSSTTIHNMPALASEPATSFTIQSPSLHASAPVSSRTEPQNSSSNDEFSGVEHEGRRDNPSWKHHRRDILRDFRRRSEPEGNYNLARLSRASLKQKNSIGKSVEISHQMTKKTRSESKDHKNISSHPRRGAGTASQRSRSKAEHGLSRETINPQDSWSDDSSSESDTLIDLSRRQKAANESEASRELEKLLIRSRLRNKAALLRNRELGCGQFGSLWLDDREIAQALRDLSAQELRCWRSWTGASKDVLTAVWAPNGLSYAIGSSADMDTLNLQYNRRNNLLLGNQEQNTLRELDEHYLDRPKPDTVSSGSNSLRDTYNTVDPRLFTTVTSLCFDKQSKRLFSGSFDNTVKVWDITEPSSRYQSLEHTSRIQLLGLSRSSELLATGQEASVGSISLYNCAPDHDVTLLTHFSSERAKHLRLTPTALQWGSSSHAENLLVAGFGEDRGNAIDRDREGDICIWDVTTGTKIKITPSAQMIFDVVWHPKSPIFAAALVPGSTLKLTDRYNTQSLLRVWSPLSMKALIAEYECPAADINEVHFNPVDTNYISASCTDGSTYIWDVRRGDQILYELSHEAPIDPIDHDLSRELGHRGAREEADTGVRFSAWDKDGRYIYTGSSDGVVKCWNPRAAPEDVFIRDVARFDSGVMCGSFSPDHDSLLIGLSKGAVQILSSSPWTHPEEEDNHKFALKQAPLSKAYENIRYVPAADKDKDESFGIESANELIVSSQIVLHPVWGAGKGPAYQGPYAGWARPGIPSSLYSTIDLDPDVLAAQIDPTESRRGIMAGGIASRSRIEEMSTLGNHFERPTLEEQSELFANKIDEDRESKRPAEKMDEDSSDEDITTPASRRKRMHLQRKLGQTLSPTIRPEQTREGTSTETQPQEVSHKFTTKRNSAENDMRKSLQRMIFPQQINSSTEQLNSLPSSDPTFENMMAQLPSYLR